MAINIKFPALAAVLVSSSILQAQPVLSQIAVGPFPAIEPVEFGGSVNFTDPPGTLGYIFFVQNGGSFNLTHLGIIDPVGNGIFDPVQVGIWNSAGSLLDSITIPPQDAAPSLTPLSVDGPLSLVTPPTITSGPGGVYYWSPLEASQDLQSGEYTIGAFFPNETYFNDGAENPDLLNFSIFETFSMANKKELSTEAIDSILIQVFRNLPPLIQAMVAPTSGPFSLAPSRGPLAHLPLWRTATSS